jgi:hypothetical protein
MYAHSGCRNMCSFDVLHLALCLLQVFFDICPMALAVHCCNVLVHTLFKLHVTHVCSADLHLDDRVGTWRTSCNTAAE